MSLTDVLIGAATLAGLGVFSYGCNILTCNHYIPNKEEPPKNCNSEKKEMEDDYSFFNKFGEDKK